MSHKLQTEYRPTVWYCSKKTDFKKKIILKQCQEKHHYSFQFYFSHFIFLPLKNLFFTHLFSNSFHTAKNHPSFLSTWHRVWIKISNFHQLIPGWILHQFFLSFRLSQCFWSILFMVLLSIPCFIFHLFTCSFRSQIFSSSPE